MPKVDPASGEPTSDAPEGPPETRGGMKPGDPGLEGATETGGTALLNRPNSDSDTDGNSSRELPAEKGGTASGGGY